MHCNCLIPLTGILGKINVIATLPSNALLVPLDNASQDQPVKQDAHDHIQCQ